MKIKISSNVGRWNYETEEYDPYELPEGVILYTRDMDRETSCASCGKKIVFGDGYTSRRIHNKYGIGFSVCTDCHEKENEIENRYKKQRVERTK